MLINLIKKHIENSKVLKHYHNKKNYVKYLEDGLMECILMVLKY